YEGQVRVWDPVNGKLLRELLGNPGAVQALAFAPDGRTLFVACDGVQVWDTVEGQRQRPLPEARRIWSVAVSPDGKVVAAGDYRGPASRADAAARRPLGRVPEGPGSLVTFSPGGRILAVGTKDAVGLFDWAACRQCLTLTGHQGIVHVGMFSPDGRWLATAG